MRIGRNAPCPCGSGKKYKKCCLLKNALPSARVIAPPAFQTSAIDGISNEDHDEVECSNLISNALMGMRRLLLRNKPHIKAYTRARKLHGEILSSMWAYFESGKFEQRISNDPILLSSLEPQNARTLQTFELYMDPDTREGNQAILEMHVYKKAPHINCITEDFLVKHRFRKPDKIEFLQCMLHSAVGLYEATEVDINAGYVNLRDVFTHAEFKVIDIGMSGDEKSLSFYYYTRIITYRAISFSTGLNLMFEKKDPFIKDFIARYTPQFHPHGDFGRFAELYNRFSQDPNRVKVEVNRF